VALFVNVVFMFVRSAFSQAAVVGGSFQEYAYDIRCGKDGSIVSSVETASIIAQDAMSTISTTFATSLETKDSGDSLVYTSLALSDVASTEHSSLPSSPAAEATDLEATGRSDCLTIDLEAICRSDCSTITLEVDEDEGALNHVACPPSPVTPASGGFKKCRSSIFEFMSEDIETDDVETDDEESYDVETDDDSASNAALSNDCLWSMGKMLGWGAESCIEALESDPTNSAAWNDLGVADGGSVNGKPFDRAACFIEAMYHSSGNFRDSIPFRNFQLIAKASGGYDCGQHRVFCVQ